jgi:hypothetical protein
MTSEDGSRIRQIAGPKLSATSLRFASLPLDPEFVTRLERAHRSYFENLRKSQRRAARRALIKKHHPPVNILGGYRFPGAPAVDLSPLPSVEWAVPSRWKSSPTAVDCPDIPEFLLRKLHVPPPPPAQRRRSIVRSPSHSWTARAAQAAAGGWRLSDGTPVSEDVAKIVVADHRVTAVGDVLFRNLSSQTYRFVE